MDTNKIGRIKMRRKRKNKIETLADTQVKHRNEKKTRMEFNEFRSLDPISARSVLSEQNFLAVPTIFVAVRRENKTRFFFFSLLLSLYLSKYSSS